MTLEGIIRAMIISDSTANTLLAGGVFTFGDLPANGVSREATPTAYDAKKYLKPICVVKESTDIRVGTLYDPAEKVQQLQQRVSVYIHMERDAANKATAMFNIKKAIYDLLHHEFIHEFGWCRRVMDHGNFKDYTLNEAYSSRVDYMVRYTIQENS